MKLCYVDRFSEDNSNYYWLKWFQRAVGIENVFPIDVRSPDLERELFACEPTHLHMGGSVKNNMVKPEWIVRLNRRFKTRATCFYGDARFSEYHVELAKVIDKIYFTNMTRVRWINDDPGKAVAEYMVHATDPEVFKPHDEEKRYDVIFTGNRWSIERGKLVGMVGKKFDLMCFGSGWGEDDNESRSVRGDRFAVECSRAKIAISQMDAQWRELEACFSGRVTQTMSCGTFFINHYTPRLEEVFKDGQHLCWYKTEEELLYWIEFYLEHDEIRERIAKQGREYVNQNFTWEKAVERILNDNRNEKRRL